MTEGAWKHIEPCQRHIDKNRASATSLARESPVFLLFNYASSISSSVRDLRPREVRAFSAASVSVTRKIM